MQTTGFLFIGIVCIEKKKEMKREKNSPFNYLSPLNDEKQAANLADYKFDVDIICMLAPNIIQINDDDGFQLIFRFILFS